eukprot:28605_1
MSTTQDNGVQTSADICQAINTAVKSRENPTPGRTYYQMDYDVDGPYKDSVFMMPLKEHDPMCDVLQIIQIKSFDHYSWSHNAQNNSINTEREIDGEEKQTLILPTLKPTKCKNINKVLLETKRIWTDKAIPRYHAIKRCGATAATVSTKVIKMLPSCREMKRKSDARKKVIQKYEKHKMILLDDGTSNNSNNNDNGKKEDDESDDNDNGIAFNDIGDEDECDDTQFDG